VLEKKIIKMKEKKKKKDFFEGGILRNF